MRHPALHDSFLRRLLAAFAGLTLWLGLLAPAPATAQTPATVGQWQNGPNLPYFPVHMHVRPDGNVMMWPGDGGVNGDDSRLWNPATGTLTALAKAGFDLFCSGHNYLPDGRLFVAGGHISNSVGLAEAAIYNPANNTWTRQPRMNLGRWYPTNTMLSNGDVLVVSGDVDLSTGSNPLPQVWQSASGTWRDLTTAQLKLALYPAMFLAPNGRVFNAGPAVTTRYLDTAGTGAWSVVADRSLNIFRDYGGAVMYEPGKILMAGGGNPPTASAEVIDLNAGTPSWRQVGAMRNARRQMNLTMLPDGRVLATGGTRGTGFNNTDPALAVLQSELWDPATEQWTPMASGTLPRLYHSIALLLPDARVLMTGGNGFTQSEIYSPPYLFAGARPTISSAPASVARGQSFFVGTPDASGIDSVAWVRLPSVTHTFDMNQAFYRSTAIAQATGGINLVAPNLTSVPSGHYMLFLLRNGVPSVAKIVQLGGTASNPVPALASLSPNAAVAGSAAFTLTVNGSSFVPGAQVRWNGGNRTTTFVSATRLTAAILAADVAAAGTAQVTVFNPAPGGGLSGALPFTISPVNGGTNPVPVLNSIAPTATTAGGGDFTLTLSGSGFTSASRVRWNGSERATVFGSSTQLSATITAADIAAAGTAQVTVFNPTPGGGTSAARSFAIEPSQNLTAAGTPVARVTAPTGGGSKNIGVIRDGIMPPVGSSDSLQQYDTWDGNNTAAEDWIGFQYAGAQTFNRVVFQEGKHFFDGGWFTRLTVQVRQNGVWREVSNLSVSPTYPNANNGTSYESYTMRFAATSGDGIRLHGEPGGSADFISVGELQVHGSGASANLAQAGTPIARVTAPTGTGSKSLQTIRDGVKPPVGSSDSALQYDTWDGNNTAAEDWIGYQFAGTQTFARIEFQEGKNFVDGGWFTTLAVQVRQNGVWVNASGLTIMPAYPGVNNGSNYESYRLQFAPISGDAIRLHGNPGGSADFISVGELEVYGP